MKPLCLFLLLLMAAKNLPAQDCHCEDAFLFLKARIEKNYAGFRDKVGSHNQAAYDAFSRGMLVRARATPTTIHCLGLMREWLAFFKDDHIQVVDNGGGLIQPVEELAVVPQKLAELKNAGGVEGIYDNDDSTYRIAIVANKTSSRDYAGVILTSQHAQWKAGQVKLELRQLRGSRFLAYTYAADHRVQLENFHFDGQSFRFGDGWWRKEGTVTDRSSPPADVAVASKKISDRTFYIRIGTFVDDNARAIDSVFEANRGVLESTPNLILDLRGNGGGSDFSYDSIIPWLYTNPIHLTGEDALATEDNIKGWQWILDSLKDLPPALEAETKDQIAQMKDHPGQLVNIANDSIITLHRIERYPEKIVVLMDEGCASSTEQFLLAAVQSRKVTLMGQPSDGAIDYTNMRPVTFPCLPFVLWVATTRNRRVGMGKGLDGEGIKPHIFLAKGLDWIEAARKYLER